MQFLAGPRRYVLYTAASSLFLYLLSILLILFTFALRAADRPLSMRGIGWLKFSLPIAVSGLFFTLVFLPGLMSGDSLRQWTQAHTVQLSDQHPAFHTFFLWLFSKLWDSPASAAIGQTLALPLVVGWGLGNLVKRRMPEKAAWLVSGIFALSPGQPVCTRLGVLYYINPAKASRDCRIMNYAPVEQPGH